MSLNFYSHFGYSTPDHHMAYYPIPITDTSSSERNMADTALWCSLLVLQSLNLLSLAGLCPLTLLQPPPPLEHLSSPTNTPGDIFLLSHPITLLPSPVWPPSRAPHEAGLTGYSLHWCEPCTQHQVIAGVQSVRYLVLTRHRDIQHMEPGICCVPLAG